MIVCEALTLTASEPESVATRVVLRDISLAIEVGSVRAVVGGAGAGKTLLGYALRGMLPEGLAVSAGSIAIGDSSVRNASVGSVGTTGDARVAWFGGDDDSGLLRAGTVRQALRSAILARFPEEQPDDLTLAAALARVGLNDVRLLERSPRDLPVGIRRRVAIALAISRPVGMRPPRVLVLDEPLAGLDATTSGEVQRALAGMQRAVRTTVVLLTRDLALARRFAHKITVLERGRLVETFSVEQKAAGTAPANAAWRAASAGVSARTNEQEGARRATAAAPAPAPATARRRGLELQDFSVTLPDGKTSIPALTLSVEPGEALGITGPFGGGKEALADALAGEMGRGGALRINGRLLFNGEAQAPRAAARSAEGRRAIQAVRAGAELRRAETHTVRTEIRRAVRRARPAAQPREVSNRVGALLRMAGLPGAVLLERICDVTSEDALRVDVARALAYDPTVLMSVSAGADQIHSVLGDVFARARSEMGIALVVFAGSSTTVRLTCDRELKLAPGCEPTLHEYGVPERSDGDSAGLRSASSAVRRAA